MYRPSTLVIKLKSFFFFEFFGFPRSSESSFESTCYRREIQTIPMKKKKKISHPRSKGNYGIVGFSKSTYVFVFVCAYSIYADHSVSFFVFFCRGIYAFYNAAVVVVGVIPSGVVFCARIVAFSLRAYIAFSS